MTEDNEIITFVSGETIPDKLKRINNNIPLLERLDKQLSVLIKTKEEHNNNKFCKTMKMNRKNKVFDKLIKQQKKDIILITTVLKKFLKGVDAGYLKHALKGKLKHVCYTCGGINLQEDGCAYYNKVFYCHNCWFRKIIGHLYKEKVKEE